MCQYCFWGRFQAPCVTVLDSVGIDAPSLLLQAGTGSRTPPNERAVFIFIFQHCCRDTRCCSLGQWSLAVTQQKGVKNLPPLGRGLRGWDAAWVPCTAPCLGGTLCLSHNGFHLKSPSHTFWAGVKWCLGCLLGDWKLSSLPFLL